MFVIVVFAIIGLWAFLLLMNPSITGFSIFQTTSQAEFDQGVYENVSFNGTALVLAGANLTGSYTSKVFNASQPSSWNNVSWLYTGLSPTLFVRVCDDSLCSDDAWNSILLSSPSSLALTNQTYFQYRADFERDTETTESSLSTVLVDYTEYTVAPSLSITQPQSGATYNSNESLLIEFSASDFSLMSCWYTLDGGATNTSLPSCLNSTLNIGFGNHILSIYANDSVGLVGRADSTFSIVSNVSTLYLLSPPSGFMTNASENALVFFVNDSDLEECNLLTDFSGAWGASSTDQAPENGTNQFNVDIDSEGAYLWGIECFDIAGHLTSSINRSISKDSTAPSITLSSPSGSFSSKQSIPLSLTVTDASTVTCVYTLTKVGAGAVLVVVMPQCANTNFNVAQNGDYQLLVSVTDASGNSGQSSTSFSVGGSSPAPGAGGGGGGGGISVDVGSLVLPKLGYDHLPNVSIRPGYSINLALDLVNQGNRFLNNCTLEGSGLYQDWIQGGEIASLSPGQRISYSFNLTLPRSLSAGTQVIGLVGACNEVESPLLFPVDVIPAEFDFAFGSYVRVGSSLHVNSTLEDLTGLGGRVSIRYSLINDDLIEVASGEEFIVLAPSASQPFTFSFDLPKDSFGEFILVIDVSTENDHIQTREDIFLSGSAVTGFAISDKNKSTLSTWGLGVLGLLIVFFVFRYLRTRWKASSPSI